MNKFVSILLISVVALSCKEGRTVLPTVPPPAVDGSMLYANEFGALRVIKTVYENGRLSTAQISPYADVGFGDTLSFSTVFSDIGGVIRNHPGTFDWSYFDETNPPYASAVLLQKNNGVGSEDHKKQFIYQWVAINQGQRSEILTMYSFINGNVRRKLEDFNYYIRGRNVKFISKSSYLVFFSDHFFREIGLPRPDGVSMSDFVHYLMKFDQSAPDPSIGEIVASFTDDAMGNAQIFVSAKKNFYTVFSPRYETTGLSPFVIRADNSGFAYTPYIKGNQVYDRAPGNEAFAMEMHPTKDSILVVSDIQFGTALLRIPQQKEDRFEIVSPIRPHTDFAPVIPVAEVFQKNAWSVRFNHDGSKLAVAYHISSTTPTVAVWHIAENRLVKYSVPRVSGTTITRLGKPAWDNDSPNRRYLYFWGANEASKQGFLFYIDTEASTTTATPVPWDAISLSEGLVLNAELIRTVSEIIQKKINP